MNAPDKVYFHVFIRWIKPNSNVIEIDGDSEVVFKKDAIPVAIDRATKEAEKRIMEKASWGATHYQIVVATITEHVTVERKEL